MKRTDKARRFRRSAGPAEDRIWQLVRRDAVDGLRFRRQHPVGPFIVDFACIDIRLIVEIDGGVHGLETVAARDRARQIAIEALGWIVLRFSNDQALNEPHIITDAIRAHAAMIRR